MEYRTTPSFRSPANQLVRPTVHSQWNRRTTHRLALHVVSALVALCHRGVHPSRPDRFTRFRAGRTVSPSTSAFPSTEFVTPPPYGSGVTPRQNTSNAALCDRLRSALHTVRDVIGSVDPGIVSGDEALELADLLGETERAAASGMARLTPRVIQTGAFAKVGFASAQDWLGSHFGHVLLVRPQPPRCCGTRGPVTRAVPAHPAGKAVSPRDRRPRPQCSRGTGGTRRLVELATGSSSFKELSDAASAAKCAARSRESARLRRCPGAPNPALALASRRARRRPGRVSLRRGGLGPRRSVLEAKTKARAKAAGAAARTRSTPTASTLSWNSSRPQRLAGNGRQSRRHALVVVDAAALRRGPPVRASAARSKASVRSLSRRPSNCSGRRWHDSSSVGSRRDLGHVIDPLDPAVDRSRRSLCVIAAASFPAAASASASKSTTARSITRTEGRRRFENLARLCPEHHDMKTHGGWKLVRTKGRWRWVAARASTFGRTHRTVSGDSASIRNQRR